MPNRMIRESCRTSDTLNQLSAEAERLFWRLTTVADDFGRFEADPRVILATCFPLKVGVFKVEAVARWFKELVACSLVRTYVSGCKQLAFFVTWEKHQYVRAKTSKYPAPTSVGTCEQMPTDSLVVTGSTVVTEQPEVDSLPRPADLAGQVRGVLDWLNQKAGKNFRPVEANLALIRARLKDGVEPYQLKAIVSRKVREWGGTEQAKYLRPETLFNRTKCEQYVGELPPASDNGHAD